MTQASLVLAAYPASSVVSMLLQPSASKVPPNITAHETGEKTAVLENAIGAICAAI